MAIKTYNDQNFVAIANAIRSKSKNPTTYKPSEMAAAISAIESGFELLPQDTVSGAISNFPDGSDGYPVVELIANIEPKQSGSGDPAPDNVRPISGFTAMNISKKGKNFFDNALFPKTITENNYYAQFQSNLGIDNPLYMPEIRIIQGIPYTLSFDIACSVEPFNVSIGIGDGRYLRDLTTKSNQTSGRVFVTFTLTAEIAAQYGNILSIRMPRFNNQTTFTATLSNIQVEIGSSNTDYEPYAAPEVKTISWESEAGTVYGGYLNVTTGELTVDTVKIRAYKTDFGDKISATIDYRQSLPAYSSNLAPTASGVDWSLARTQQKCDKAKIANPNTETTYGTMIGVIYTLGIAPDNASVRISDALYQTFSSDNDYVEFSYKLTTPQTYQLDPEEVKTLLGVNNIYADTGNVSLTYRADVDLYIAKKIAEGA